MINRGISSFGYFIDTNKSKSIEIIESIYSIFEIEPNMFFISGGKYPNSSISKEKFISLINKNGYEYTYMIDALYKSKFSKNIDAHLSIFFCKEKSCIKFGYFNSLEKKNCADKFWRITSEYLDLHYGFYINNSKYDPMLYSTGSHINKFNSIESLLHKKQIEKEKYWFINYYKSKDGFIRDVFPINIVNENQLNQAIVGKTNLKEYIKDNNIGELKPFKDGLFIWNLTDEDLKKAEQLKKICNSGTILNAPTWKF